jgi:subtilase family serine protease
MSATSNVTSASGTRRAEFGTLHFVSASGLAAPAGFAPTQIRNVYGFNAMGSDALGKPIDGRGQIVGIVLPNDDPYIKTDLAQFLKTYSYLRPMNGLDAAHKCTVSKTVHAVPCFQVVYANGVKPPSTGGNDAEAAIDSQWSHVTAEGADIVFVEAASYGHADLLRAIDKAVALGASVVSMSWFSKNLSAADNSHFQVSTAGFVSGSGDLGCPENTAFYPAPSTYVLQVGGTSLTISGTTNSETAWALSGGNANPAEPRPGYQLNWQPTSHRAYNDVAYNAVNYSIYASIPKAGWAIGNGVSVGIPQWAGLVADADQARMARGKGVLASSGLNSGMYLAASSHAQPPGVINKAMFNDITSGNSGGGVSCKGQKGYDWTTGLGTPHADALVNELANL